VREFLETSISPLMRFPHYPDDFREAARLIGGGDFQQRGQAVVFRRADCGVRAPDKPGGLDNG
jgi:hypothetical protein